MEEAFDFVWEHGTSPLFSDSEMDSKLQVVFSSVMRAVERNDRDLIGWFADRLTTVSARLLRNKRVEPSVYFAVYARALGDITFAMSSENGAVNAAHNQVLRHKAMLPLISALHASPSALTASALAERLSMSASNLSPVLRAAEDAGLVSCEPVGRAKYCSITRLGQVYMDAIARPMRHQFATRVIAEYWTQALQAPNDDSAQDEAIDAAVRAYPSLTPETVMGLCKYATKADGERYRACKLRDELSEQRLWTLVFNDLDVEKALLGRTRANKEMKCEVVYVTDECAEFRPVGAKRTKAEFKIAFRLFLKEAVSLRESTSGEELPVEAASLQEIRKAVEVDGQECFV